MGTGDDDKHSIFVALWNILTSWIFKLNMWTFNLKHSNVKLSSHKIVFTCTYAAFLVSSAMIRRKEKCYRIIITTFRTKWRLFLVWSLRWNSAWFHSWKLDRMEDQDKKRWMCFSSFFFFKKRKTKILYALFTHKVSNPKWSTYTASIYPIVSKIF